MCAQRLKCRAPKMSSARGALQRLIGLVHSRFHFDDFKEIYERFIGSDMFLNHYFDFYASATLVWCEMNCVGSDRCGGL